MNEVKEDEVLPESLDGEITSEDDYSDEEAEEENDVRAKQSETDICIEISDDDDEEVATFAKTYKEVCFVAVISTNL